MTTFDERLQDPLYLYYVKLGLCLAILKEGLEHLAKRTSVKLHQNIFAVSSCKNNPSSKKGLCRNAKMKYGKRGWDPRCCTGCLKLIKEVAERSSDTFNPKKLHWGNSDCTGWTGSYGYWQLAKLFMNKGLKPSQTCPQDTDICGILNFMRNCRVARLWVTNEDYLKKVIVYNLVRLRSTARKKNIVFIYSLTKFSTISSFFTWKYLLYTPCTSMYLCKTGITHA